MSTPYGEASEVVILRDCPAVAVPWGSPATLEAGSLARITQRLGGTFTVVVGGNLYRIDGREADALGLEPLPARPEGAAARAEPVSAEAVAAAAWDALATCYDPEIPIDIVNLGLVYACEVTPASEAAFRIDVRMTLTAPGCGMGMLLAEEAGRKLEAIPGVADVKVALVWDPPWSRERMSEAARLEMGIL